MTVKVIPCGHKVLIRPDVLDEEHQVKDSDIKIVIVRQDKRAHEAAQIIGTIISYGPEAWRAFRVIKENGEWQDGKPWVKPGDRVYYSKFAGHHIEPNEGEVLVLINDEDINAVIVEED